MSTLLSSCWSRAAELIAAAETNHAVVIAGGGPTGLMLAGELALAGVDVAIAERRPNQDLAGTCTTRSVLSQYSRRQSEAGGALRHAGRSRRT